MQSNEQHPPHVKRMMVEGRELAAKLDALDRFQQPSNPIYASMTDNDKGLLLAQASSMSAYLAILTIRMNRATGTL